ncbi:Uncharacterized protein SCG7109_AA_00080 [Chlamydiales bacterium SCGC AG-110-M15]|nr:Uncharacterized protein SCG7109_AA_00080 [Chlamydiales bacterium SCGC AG-110-M15]
MRRERLKSLESWPQGYIHDIDLVRLIGFAPNSRYSFVKRALGNGDLLRLRRGLYLIRLGGRDIPDIFEIAPQIYPFSYVSFESALSHHSWIPEAVYSCTCATAKRKRHFQTPLGFFVYYRTPLKFFYLGVSRHKHDGNISLIADPWKAIADLIYVRKKSWDSIADLCGDLRIEKEQILHSDYKMLKQLSEHYQSRRVREALLVLLHDLIENYILGDMSEY